MRLSNFCRDSADLRLEYFFRTHDDRQVALVSENATEGEAMLRRGIVALMVTVMSVGSIHADQDQSNRLMDFLRGPSIGRPNQKVSRSRPARPKPAGGVTHAVVADAEKQIPEIRQTSSQPVETRLQPAQSTPQPTPVQFNAAQHPQPAPAVAPGRVIRTAAPAYRGPMVVAAPVPAQFVSAGMYGPPAAPGGQPYGAPAGGLYPAPKPGIPAEVGGTAIVNPAFHPHEMMHAHRYKAMYGPFYHKVNGHWIMTPFGIWSKENWKLQGTTVDVQYKSRISPFALFCPPIHR